VVSVFTIWEVSGRLYCFFWNNLWVFNRIAFRALFVTIIFGISSINDLLAYFFTNIVLLVISKMDILFFVFVAIDDWVYQITKIRKVLVIFLNSSLKCCLILILNTKLFASYLEVILFWSLFFQLLASGINHRIIALHLWVEMIFVLS